MPAEPTSPVELIQPDLQKSREPETGIGLCLSGGGYRAMLFHLGALWRLAELGLLSNRDHTRKQGDEPAQTLGSLQRISSVSGGSITAGLVGLRWKDLKVDEPGLVERYQALIVEPIRRFAGVSIAGKDLSGATNLIASVLLPGSVHEHVAKAYAKHLFGTATCADLPATPRFVINASNLQSGALWRFMSPAIRDWRVGEIRNTRAVSLARAVAASSAFPPVLAPAVFEFKESDYTPGSGTDLQKPPFTTEPTLADGGVYDNLGLETVYKRFATVLVSNAGAPFSADREVSRDWLRLAVRVASVLDNQVRNLRQRILVDAFKRGLRFGAYWDIDQDIQIHPCRDALPCPHEQTLALAATPTDLSKKDSRTQDRLINWGYAICDAAIRAWVNDQLPPPNGFPCPNGVG
jgi:NTE family protein